MEQPGEPGRLDVEYSQGVQWWADCYPQWQKRVQPSSQGPCICPEDGVAHACPRHEYMLDYVGQDPFKDHLRELREVTAQLAWKTAFPTQLLGYPERHDQTDRQVIASQEEDPRQEEEG